MFKENSIREGSRMAVEMQTKQEKFWSGLRKKNALKLFHEVARHVPAYKDFLKKHRVNPTKIKKFSDFEFVPQTSKNDYLKHYPLEKLAWDGSLEKPLVFTSTSGSTGAPFYFPRGEELDWEYSILAERFLLNSSHGARTSTLVIVGFGMGVWIGGLITYKAFEMASQRGYPVSIITPGINKVEIFHAFRELSPHYDQTIFIGYPPFMKDVLDEAVSREHINLKNLNVRLLSAAEAYTEKFRDYIVKKAGVHNPYLDTLNIYGTADIGAMAWETPTSILIRRLAMRNKNNFHRIFAQIYKTPTLAQYNPSFITFEAPGGEILVTGNNTIPLIRYAVGDRGGVADFGELERKIKGCGINLSREARGAGIQALYKLPFVYVYERADFAVKLHLRDIYPESIKDVLINKPFNKALTGKFVIGTKYNAKQDQYLEINFELRKDKKITKRLKEKLQKKILNALYLKSAGPGNPAEFIKRPNLVKAIFWNAEHPLHFRPGIKQKWVKKLQT